VLASAPVFGKSSREWTRADGSARRRDREQTGVEIRNPKTEIGKKAESDRGQTTEVRGQRASQRVQGPRSRKHNQPLISQSCRSRLHNEIILKDVKGA